MVSTTLHSRLTLITVVALTLAGCAPNAEEASQPAQIEVTAEPSTAPTVHPSVAEALETTPPPLTNENVNTPADQSTPQGAGKAFAVALSQRDVNGARNDAGVAAAQFATPELAELLTTENSARDVEWEHMQRAGASITVSGAEEITDTGPGSDAPGQAYVAWYLTLDSESEHLAQDRSVYMDVQLIDGLWFVADYELGIV